ncbi:3-keto-L-gulonate-6-phosphate decarboxylase UlaD [Breznakiella homolactica]|uniref:3-keto-L-gulonate-6-phosphate decarboxylase UlaD n=1 Tax=Breznakiella homolactica TaxID=2798577 RepID=A0A7T7XJU8_9SPIR|nr:3-keto-L-gulonate-6-phosphate decarboxylase UlaD [Breznakiella homolactica]QQO07739.1 3-keto-L-gulonate-6-phosphate decarboxylase UlaD [Breznakiella homolactica]
MKKPLLQIALDQTDLSSALDAAEKIAPHVDVLEAGTILCFAEGVRAVSELRSRYPGHIILADLKAADAGAVLAELVFSRGATWMTLICSAPLATMQAALDTAKKYSGDVQVELYGDWTFEHAQSWLAMGITQAIYHRGRDAQAAGKGWDRDDIERVEKLSRMGMDVSVTGGLTPEDLRRFRGIPVKCFIAGRSLYDCPDPAKAAGEFKTVIDSEWT